MKHLMKLIFLFLLTAQIYPQWTERQLPQPVDVWGLESSDSLIFAGTEIGFLQPGYIFRSSDQGLSWDTLTGLPFAGGWSLAETDSVLVAGSFGWGMYLSYDKGDTWAVPDSGIAPVENVHVIIKHNNYLFAGTAGTGNGIFRSADDGRHWISVNEGLTDSSFLSLASNGTDLYAGASFTGEVFRSTDDGSSWFFAGNGLPANSNVACLAADGAKVYAGLGSGEGVYYSSDNGSNWTNISSSAITGEVWAIALADTSLLVGTIGSGIFLTQDNGISWRTINEGLTNLSIRSIIIDTNNYVFAGTTNGFVYSRPLSEVVTDIVENHYQPLLYSLYQNYPNPFNPTTSISYSIPAYGNVSLIVYDVTGKEVETLVNEKQQAGAHTVIFNADNLATGVYFYRLQTNNLVTVKKMLLLK